MKKAIKRLIHTFFRKDQELRVKLFHVLAMAGTVICILMAIQSFAVDVGVSSVLINVGASILSASLLLYSAKSGNYQFCYMITIILIFFVLFSVLFFTGGGYRSGMPFFFLFAIVYTVYMLEGIRMILVTAVEMIYYSGLILYAWIRPEMIRSLESERAMVFDILTGLLTVGFALGITMYLQFRMYQIQQKELKQAREEAEAANREKSRFLAYMSHEIRTPLNAVVGANEMIARETEKESIRRYSSQIMQSSFWLLDLISELLEMSKIESGKLEIVMQSYDSRLLLKQLEESGREQAEKKGLQFSMEIEEPIPKVLIGDRLHIRQAVSNFINNAVKYTDRGSVCLRISAEAQKDSDEILLKLSVADTGIGISKEDQKNLFKAFSRVNTESHRYVAGTGLGLAIAKEYAEKMDGHVSVESEPGKGSTFTLVVSQKIGAKDEKSFVAPQGRILVADDNEDNLLVLGRLLERTLLQIDTALNAEEIIEKAEENVYHVILMDYMMPDMDGTQVLHKLREEGILVPAVALTANALAGTSEMLIEAGFADVVTKPILASELEAVLLKYLPEKLVTRVKKPENRGHLPDTQEKTEQLRHIGEKLSRYDVDFSCGLNFLNGDFEQYRMRAGIFAEYYEQGIRKAKVHLDKKEYELLKYEVHSLKANAQALGAMELSRLVEQMELKYRDHKDTDYMEEAAPLMFLEWSRAGRGFAWLVTETTELNWSTE